MTTPGCWSGTARRWRKRCGGNVLRKALYRRKAIGGHASSVEKRMVRRLIHSSRWSRYSRTNIPASTSCGSISKPLIEPRASATTRCTLGRARTRSSQRASTEPAGGGNPFTLAAAFTCGSTERSAQPNSAPLKYAARPSACSRCAFSLAICSPARAIIASATSPLARPKTRPPRRVRARPTKLTASAAAPTDARMYWANDLARFSKSAPVARSASRDQRRPSSRFGVEPLPTSAR